MELGYVSVLVVYGIWINITQTDTSISSIYFQIFLLLCM